MKTRFLPIALVGVALVATACGRSENDDAAAAPVAPAAASCRCTGQGAAADGSSTSRSGPNVPSRSKAVPLYVADAATLVVEAGAVAR